ncbi:MAG: uroporphyrinogen-III C-methyltransferase [Bacteroidota bacterium]|nr:uroporphyrinogen-III C-methyltransferase [Bacteroidota bacterium]
MNKIKNTGKVILAGAGPGDPDLITIKTVNYLQQADVVLTDRLVSEEILTRYVNKYAEIIRVGKQCRRGISTSQKTINELIVEHALQGKLVVRLKGGDVSIFSNILDELQTLQEHNISFEIIPGVTASLGAAAYAGIPLTAREYSTAVRLLTLYKSTVVSDEYWKELAKTDDTLVFYMSSETLDDVVEKLMQNNIPSDKLLAVVEQATTPFQQVYISDLCDYQNTLKGKIFLSPSLVIIGKVVSLHEKFTWFTSNKNHEHYFKPLTKSPLVDHEQKIVATVLS